MNWSCAVQWALEGTQTKGFCSFLLSPPTPPDFLSLLRAIHLVMGWMKYKKLRWKPTWNWSIICFWQQRYGKTLLICQSCEINDMAGEEREKRRVEYYFLCDTASGCLPTFFVSNTRVANDKSGGSKKQHSSSLHIAIFILFFVKWDLMPWWQNRQPPFCGPHIIMIMIILMAYLWEVEDKAARTSCLCNLICLWSLLFLWFLAVSSVVWWCYSPGGEWICSIYLN